MHQKINSTICRSQVAGTIRLRSDRPYLNRLFPAGIPATIPQGAREPEPVFMIGSDEFFEIDFERVSDWEEQAIASLYSSDRVTPLQAACFALSGLALIPLDWVDFGWVADLEAFATDGGAV
jgi:hypothetical protein